LFKVETRMERKYIISWL